MEIDNNSSNYELQIMQKSSMIPARANQALALRACLKSAQSKKFKIYYTLEYPADVGPWEPPNISKLVKNQREDKKFLYEVLATGVFRSMEVTDIFCEDVSKRRLWELFNLVRFNDILRSMIPETKRTERSARENMKKTEPIKELELLQNSDSSVDFDFGGKPLGSPSRIIQFCVKNNGVVAVDWSFSFPNDLEIEVEQWADPGDYSDEQLHYELILENEIFKVSPKSGVLGPNESVIITCEYRHTFAGSHHIPVLFRLRSGTASNPGGSEIPTESTVDIVTPDFSTIREGGGAKDILVNLTGYSVPLPKRYIHFSSSTHTFEPCDIGSSEFPVQVFSFTLRSVSLDYSIDLSSVNKLEFPIFQCMKTKGTILPGETDQVQWIFRPLEAKNYEVDVPITVEDGLTRVITFKGQGIRNIIGTVKDAKQLDRPSPAVPIIKGRQSDLAQLSIERLNFGHVPLNASLCQIFVLRNTSDCATISYSWESPSFHNSICSVNIKPISGSLVPGRSQVCKVTVKVGLRPGFYDFDLVCKVSNATEFNAYTAAKEAFESHTRDNRPLSGAGGESRPSSSRAKHDLTKYKPLPPIAAPTIEGTKKISTADTAMNQELFLGINIQSHEIYEFKESFSGVFYHEKPSFLDNDRDNQVVTTLNSDYQDLINDVFDKLLDDVINDPDMPKLLDEVPYEPLVYFAQLSSPSLDDDSQSQNDTEYQKTDIYYSIIRSTEFTNIAESVLEGTIFNILQEANMSEFDITKTVPLAINGAPSIAE
ncbi:MAG: hypothetical protein SGCHY_002012 [Lobulomycetales sp.]